MSEISAPLRETFTCHLKGDAGFFRTQSQAFGLPIFLLQRYTFAAPNFLTINRELITGISVCLGDLNFPRWIRMPKTQTRSRSKDKRNQQLDKAFITHYKSLGLKTAEAYIQWCAKNGFSRRTKKTARERALEKEKHAHKTANPLTRIVADYSGMSRNKLRELIFSGAKFDPHDLPCDLKPLGQTVMEISHGTRVSNRIRKESFRQLIEFCELRKLKFVRTNQRINCHGPNFYTALAWLSRHRHLWVRQPESFKSRTKNATRLFESFVRQLLVRFEMPAYMFAVWFVNHQEKLTRDQKLFLHLAAGHSVRRFGQLPITLTKRMGHFFMQAPSNTIGQAVRWAEIRGLGGSERLADAVANTFLANHFGNQEFWRSVFEWFVSHPMLDVQQVGPIADYLLDQRFGGQHPILGFNVPQPNLSMRGRTPEALVRAVERWHDRLMIKTGPWKGTSWKPTAIEPFIFETGVTNKKIWTIHELLSARELFQEGRKLNHCVSTYTSSCVSRTTSIWTMQASSDEGTKRLLTIEVGPRTKRIIQVRGKNNRYPREHEIKIISRWAQEAGLKFNAAIFG